MALGQGLHNNIEHFTILSAYDTAVRNGFVGSISQWFETLEGKSAYEVWLEDNTGSKEDFLNSLVPIPSIEFATFNIAQGAAQTGVYPLTLETGNMGSQVQSGKVFLHAGVTYDLYATLQIRSEFATYAFFNSAGTQISKEGVSASVNGASAVAINACKTFYTPSQDELIEIRVKAVSDFVQILNNQSTVTINSIAGH